MNTTTLTPRQKWQRDLFAQLKSAGFEVSREGTSAEVYLCGFATVQLSVNRDTLVVERYYDNELIDIDRHVSEESEVEECAPFPDTAALVRRCRALLATIRNDEPILNFAE